MQANFKLLYPAEACWQAFPDSTASAPFSPVAIDWLSDLSASLLSDRATRAFPDVVTFAYFCRKANLRRLADEYHGRGAGHIRLGRGVVFHVAPSNVPMNFGYTLVAGMLAGNTNIVRVSSKHFPQVDLVIRHMHKISGAHPQVDRSVAVVRYDRTSDATALFSSMAAVRVIWGGDQTIANIRRNALPPRAFDVCFADRYSIALIHPQAVVDADGAEITRLAAAFYNDTYLFDQNACSAPHVVFWLDAPCIFQAKQRFWSAVHAYAAERYVFQDKMAVDKLTAMCRQAVEMDINIEPSADNLLVRTTLNALTPKIESIRCPGGYFSEYTIGDIEEILPVITPRYQTMAYYGIDPATLRDFVTTHHPVGLDRIVPVGETTAFSLVWDGYDLIDTLSRQVTVL